MEFFKFYLHTLKFWPLKDQFKFIPAIKLIDQDKRSEIYVLDVPMAQGSGLISCESGRSTSSYSLIVDL